MVLPFTVLAQVTSPPSQVHTGLEYYKDLAQIVSYVVGIVAATSAVWTYRQNSQRERARWVFELYEKFFEESRYKMVRETLDSPPDSPEIKALLEGHISEFTDYLNFFELVEFLKRRKQLEESDVMALLEYYMGCLKRHRVVVDFIRDEDNGFKLLKEFLSDHERT